ncbi:hypothetical protein [Emticicia fontis]
MAEIQEKVRQTENPIEDQALIDLVCNYLQKQKQDCTPFDARRWISIMADSMKDSNLENSSSEEVQIDLIKKYKSIGNCGLLSHLKRKGIPLDIAKQHLVELKVFDPMEQKHYFVLGFAHEKDGFVISCPYFEDWVGKRSISFIKGQDKNTEIIHIFPTFWDYLSLLDHWKCHHLQTNSIILNSYDCIEQVKGFVYKNGYKKAYTFLSNDKTGLEAAKHLYPLLNKEEELVHIALNKFYQPFANVEQWHQNQIQKK